MLNECVPFYKFFKVKLIINKTNITFVVKSIDKKSKFKLLNIISVIRPVLLLFSYSDGIQDQNKKLKHTTYVH